MSRITAKRQRATRISMWNWLGTLFLSIIPGVNIIAWILMIAMGKRQAKRSFAAAALVLTALLAILYVAAFLAFGDQLTDFARDLAASVTANPTPTP